MKMSQSSDDENYDFGNDCIDVDALDLDDSRLLKLRQSIEDLRLRNEDKEWLILERPTSESFEELHNILLEQLAKRQKEKLTTPVVSSVQPKATPTLPDKSKFDSRTFVRPKKQNHRPSLNAVVDGSLQPFPSLASRLSTLMHGNRNSETPESKYLTYNKYNSPLYLGNQNLALSEKKSPLSLSSYGDCEDLMSTSDISLVDSMTGSVRKSQPINIDLNQPTHNLSKFRRSGLNAERTESFLSMSPPSLVESIVDDEDGRKERLNGIPNNRESMDQQHSLLSSISMSILEEKDMATSFLSVTTQQDHDSLSISPSLVSSINSSFCASKKSGDVSQTSSFAALLESGERLTNRPRISLYKNTITKKSESSETNDTNKENQDEAFQCDDRYYKDMELRDKIGRESLNKTLDKEELNEIIMARQKLSNARNALPRPSVNLIERESISQVKLPEPTLQPRKTSELNHRTRELHERTIDLKNKLSKGDSNLIDRESLSQSRQQMPLLAPRKMNETIDLNDRTIRERYNSESDSGDTNDTTTITSDKSFDNTVVNDETFKLNTITRDMNGSGERKLSICKKIEDCTRENPKRNGTFRMNSPCRKDGPTIVYLKKENSSEQLDPSVDRTLSQDEWKNERAMAGSSESTDASSSISPPEYINHFANAAMQEKRLHQATSTPLILNHDPPMSVEKHFSPISSKNDGDHSPKRRSPYRCKGDSPYSNKVDSSTMIRRKKDEPVPIKASSPVHVKPAIPVRRSGLPQTKTRQYSSHRDLSRMPVAGPLARTRIGGPVYASNPALSPTLPAAPLLRRDSYTIATNEYTSEKDTREVPALVRQTTKTFTRPQSQLITPKDIRSAHGNVAASNPKDTIVIRKRSTHQSILSNPRPVSMASQLQLLSRVRPPTANKPVPVIANNKIPTAEPRAIPRVSRLPAPKTTKLRPPSVYSLAPSAGDAMH